MIIKLVHPDLAILHEMASQSSPYKFCMFFPSFCTNLAKETNDELKKNLSRGIETLHEGPHKHSRLQGPLDR